MRVFDAPRELVFKAWTDPAQVTKWWGPNGFTTTTNEMDVRPGGVWRFMMHGPDGVDYPNRIDFIEVIEPERLVYDHGDDDGGSQFHVTVLFVEEGARTRLTMEAVFETAAELDRVIQEHGAAEGATQHLARLAEHLAEITSR
jgi:uncharacterized protein YndB with AHSA1/START domain